MGLTTTLLGGATNPFVVELKKTADETVNNSATLQDDDALVSASLAAGTYFVEAGLFYESGATPDFKATIASTDAGVAGAWYPSSDNANAEVWNGNNPGTALGTGALFNNNSQIRYVKMDARVIQAGAGIIKVQWAQNTQDASDTKLLKGSWLRITRIA